MYEYLSGTISELAPTHAVLDVGGVGYFLQISLQTYSEIEHSDRVKLFVHYVVREDAQLRHLISVSGVGGNTARMILSTYSPRELQGIIATENAVLLKNVKGLGLKTAQKIIVELSGKMAGLGLTGDTVTAPVAGGDYEEALAALVMLGFGKAAADKVVKIVARENPGASVEDLVRMSLKRL